MVLSDVEFQMKTCFWSKLLKEQGKYNLTKTKLAKTVVNNQFISSTTLT